MDPNQALTDMRDAVRRLADTSDDDDFDRDDVVRLFTAADALDEWLSMGGFLPADWRR
ncbi:hypothetical protein [Mycolicibacter kumamotonensis]|uniref:hypothetical protein n=1 Tax=Mycolicibacter kumamotonensis TaxID=354243 RepID=UPI0013F4D8B3|nr:hypothetical protein [Mycolicibacter kumamotonensis]